MNAPSTALLPLPVAMLLVVAALGSLMGGVRWLGTRFQWHPELQRKAVHIGMGLSVLPLPWLFDRTWPVVVLALLAVGALLSLRWHPRLRSDLGSVLGGVQRVSLGEIYFPISVALLFAISHEEPFFYIIPIAILTLADAVAALIGVRYGTVQYLTSDGSKSVEGSVAFFFVTFMTVLVPVLLLTQIDRVVSLLLALIIAFLVMMLEGIAWRGLDNLFIPIGAYAFLHHYVGFEPAQLAGRFLAGLALLVFVFFWRRRSPMDDAALMASALVGYAALMLGGWIWILPPLAFFVVEHLVWPKQMESRWAAPGEDAPRRQNVQGVVSVATAGLIWLFIFAATGVEWTLVPFAVSFGAELAMYAISRVARVPASSNLRIISWAVLAAWALAVVPAVTLGHWLAGGLDAAPPGALGIDLLTGLGAVVLISWLYYRLIPRLYGVTRGQRGNLAFQLLGALASAVPCLGWWLRQKGGDWPL